MDENELSTVDIHNHHRYHLRRVLQADTDPQLIAKLTASNGGEENNFGDNNAVAISNRDQTIVIGARGHDYNRGAVYLYKPVDDDGSGGYTEIAILTSSDRYFSDNFGTSVAINDDWIAVGADKHPNATGAVYLYRMMDGDTETGAAAGGGATELAKITASDEADGNLFGASVAIDGPFLVVGADGDADNGYLSGAAYIYSRDSTSTSDNWSEVTKLKPSDGGVEHVFGWSVAISGNTVVVGTNGAHAAYVFQASMTTSDGSWSQVSKLTSNAASTDSFFGQAVAVTNNTIVVGASEDYNENGVYSGSVFVYNNDNGVLTEVAKLIAEGGQIAEFFGYAAAISKDESTMVVGAPGNNEMGQVAGSAYIYQKLEVGFGVAWTQVGQFVAPDGATDDRVGGAVAISKNIAVLGTDGDDISLTVDAGSAYVLNLAPTSPTVAPTQALTTLEPTIMETTHTTEQPTLIPGTPTLEPESPKSPSNDSGVTSMNKESTEPSSGLQPSVIIAIAVVFGVAVTVVVGLFLFLNFRFKIQQQQLLVHQQHRRQEEPQEPRIVVQSTQPPLPPSSDYLNPPSAESPVNASSTAEEVAFAAQAVYPRSNVPTTIAAVAYVEEEAVVVVPPSMGGSSSSTGTPQYKDQVRDVAAMKSSSPARHGHPAPLYVPTVPRTHSAQQGEADGKPQHRKADPPTR